MGYRKHTAWLKQTKNLMAATVVVLFGIVGVVLLLASHAATPIASIEVESGTISSPATAVSDISASGGGAVKFGTGSVTVPPQCLNGGSYLWSNLETCGWPAATNTGYIGSQCPGGVLTNVGSSNTSTITLNTANATVSCQNITGCLDITATNVTLTNVKVTCSSGKTGTNANGTAAIKIESGASATINQAEINGLNAVHACIWHQGVSLTASKINCYGIDDGIFSWGTGTSTDGDHFTIQDSYFHDFTVKTANGHIDGYQTEGAANGLISHNTYLMTSDSSNDSDSAIAIWNGNKNSHDITVQNNLITGGGFAIYAEDYNPSETSPAGGYSVTNIFFNNNSFSTHLFGGTCVGSFGVWYPRGAPSDAWHRSGNKVLETGVSLDTGNPAGCN